MAVSTTHNSLLVLFDEELAYTKPISSDLCQGVQYKMEGAYAAKAAVKTDPIRKCD